MDRLCNLIWLASLVIILPASCSTNEKLDWKAALFDMYYHFEMNYWPDKMDDLVRDVYAEGFVYLSPYSILQADFAELSKHYIARRELGHFHTWPPSIASTCGNTSMWWTKITFTDDKGLKRDGFQSALSEYVDNKAKFKNDTGLVMAAYMYAPEILLQVNEKCSIVVVSHHYEPNQACESTTFNPYKMNK